MSQDVIFAIVRHLITALGGGVAMKYGLGGQEVQAGAGALITLGALAWSIWDKNSRKLDAL